MCKSLDKIAQQNNQSLLISQQQLEQNSQMLKLLSSSATSTSTIIPSFFQNKVSSSNPAGITDFLLNYRSGLSNTHHTSNEPNSSNSLPEPEFTLGNNAANSSPETRQASLTNNVNVIPATESNEDPNNEIPEVENGQIFSNNLLEENSASYSTSSFRRIEQGIRYVDITSEFSLKYKELFEGSIPKELWNESIALLKTRGYRNLLKTIDGKHLHFKKNVL